MKNRILLAVTSILVISFSMAVYANNKPKVPEGFKEVISYEELKPNLLSEKSSQPREYKNKVISEYEYTIYQNNGNFSRIIEDCPHTQNEKLYIGNLTLQYTYQIDSDNFAGVYKGDLHYVGPAE
ncbi:hypothetical protein [Peptoniphilus sp. oral taxon 386]|uniref:hypothetical protein n=1 Tax=Peptoniphilus sp. oral taxon 386 TaxID=652713 RepID=UPI0001DA9A16|nr:hypothetical protein [Peptoniphilus sp. oral taxon 386]EFI41840.1 hypothetical protein HMPREF0629_00468 [Peptoniphilus sp. oral taxon 386 str. F0131]